MADENELNTFREEWMTEVAVRISGSNPTANREESSIGSSRTRQSSADLTRTFSNLEIADSNQASSSETSPNKKEKENGQSAVEAYVSANRFERQVFFNCNQILDTNFFRMGNLREALNSYRIGSIR